jgi:hypothetical protein
MPSIQITASAARTFSIDGHAGQEVDLVARDHGAEKEVG